MAESEEERLLGMWAPEGRGEAFGRFNTLDELLGISGRFLLPGGDVLMAEGGGVIDFERLMPEYRLDPPLPLPMLDAADRGFGLLDLAAPIVSLLDLARASLLDLAGASLADLGRADASTGRRSPPTTATPRTSRPGIDIQPMRFAETDIYLPP